MSQDYGCRVVRVAEFQVARFRHSRRTDRARGTRLDLSRILTVEVEEPVGLRAPVRPGFVRYGDLLICACETPAAVETDRAAAFRQISTAALAPARDGSADTPIHRSPLGKGKEVRP